MPKLFLCSCHFPFSTLLTTKLSVSSLPFLSPASFFFWHSSSSLSISFTSIWTVLHLRDDECVSAHTLTCRPSDLKLFVCLCSRSLNTHLETHTWKHTHTLNSPVYTLSDAHSMNWRPSFHGKHPMRPHCMCDCVRETEQGRDSEEVHALSLMRAVYYSSTQSAKHILNYRI